MAAVTVPALGQSKIATVDLAKIFTNYYKTKLATAAVEQHLDELDKDYSNMAARLKEQTSDYETMRDAAEDQAVSQDERDKRTQAADDALKQLEDSRANMAQFERQAQMTINDQKQRMQANIMGEIKKAVADKAKAAGDTLVLDTAAESAGGTPMIVFSTGDNDLTDDVLKELNSTAPPDLPEPTAPPVYLSTNSAPFDINGSPTPPAAPGTQ